MKALTIRICTASILAACLTGASARSQDEGIEELHRLIRQARAEIATLRTQFTGRERTEGTEEHEDEHGRQRREGRDRSEHAEGRERREGRDRGEHAEGRQRREGGEHREGGGEESGQRMAKDEAWNRVRRGARLILAYDASTGAFTGTVENTTERILSDVRVEVHLSNGTELGPTRRTDLRPGQKIEVELSAIDEAFDWWTTHPEQGREEGHDNEGAGEHRRGGEERHGEGGEHRGEEGAAGGRPGDPSLRALYNEIQLLRGDLQALRAAVATSRQGRRR